MADSDSGNYDAEKRTKVEPTEKEEMLSGIRDPDAHLPEADRLAIVRISPIDGFSSSDSVLGQEASVEA